MRLEVISNNKTTDITHLVSSISWSGDFQQVARKLDFDIAVSETDKYLPRVNLNLADLVKFYDAKGNELFQGHIFYKEKSKAATTMKVTAYDNLIYLLKSKGTFNFKKLSAEAITNKVAASIGLSCGTLAKTGIPLNLLIDGEPLYDVIMKAYTKARLQMKEKSFYLPRMEKGKLNIIEKGKEEVTYTLDFIDTNYSENMENVINRVRIYDEKGNHIGKIDGISPQKYGVFQEILKKEQGKDPYTAAKNMLRDIEKTGSVSGLGDLKFLTGKAIIIKEPFTNLAGRFFIDGDTHTWSNGVHKMDLKISFEELMDTKE